jgi:hypothetical protein
MSSDTVATDRALSDRPALRARRLALRLAFGVTACFAVVETFGWDATFLAPLLTAQMLAKLPRSPSLWQGLGMVILIKISTGVVLVLTMALIGSPTVLLLALGLLIYLSFYAHLRGAPELATLLLQISAVSLPVIAVISPAGAGGFAATLFSAGVAALLTVWAAFAAFPDPYDVEESHPAAEAAGAAEPRTAAWLALLDTSVLLPVLVWFVLDAAEVAVVVLIVIVTVLRQHDPRQGRRAALGLIAGNLIGGVAAAVAYNLILLGNTLGGFVIVCLAASLIFAGRIVTAGTFSPVYVVAFATFILLLGLGLSPLPGGSGEAFASRLLNVLLASAYAIGAVSIVEHRQRSIGDDLRRS